MKSNMKKVVAVLIAITMTLSLTGCIKAFDATAFVQAELDLLTRHDTAQYVKVIGVSEEKAEDIYKEAIKKIDISKKLFQDIEVSKEIKKGYTDWFTNVLKKTKYTILEAEKDGDTYSVVVEIQPVKAYEEMSDRVATETVAYGQNVVEIVATGGEIPSDEQRNNDIYRIMLNVLNGILENITYGETVSVGVKIIQNEDGQYEIDEASFKEIGATLIESSDFIETK